MADSLVKANTVFILYKLTNTIGLQLHLILPFLQSSEVHTPRWRRCNNIILQRNCARRTCSRSLHSNRLGRRSNPYSPRYRPTALTKAIMVYNTSGTISMTLDETRMGLCTGPLWKY